MKRMKQYLSMAALALVGAVMTGCSNEDSTTDTPQQPANTGKTVTLTTTVGLDSGTRALDGSGNKTFAEGDEMAVIYKNTNNETMKAVGTLTDGAGTASATFTFTLTNPDNTKAIRYIYPAAMAKDVATDATIDDSGTVDYDKLNNQDGTLATLGSNLDLCTLDAASWTSGTLPTGTLENQLAILAITLKNSDGSSDITSSITGLTVGDGTNTYAVTRETGAGPIYVAIRPATGATITVNATDGSKNYTKTLTDKTYDASSGYNVSWRMTEKPDFLSGEFSVSSTKKVKFSKGNLRYASGTWSFFDNQYDYYTSYSADAWDKFGWSTSATTYGMNSSTSSGTYSGDFVDWGATMGTGWFTLTSDEWTYLFNTRSASTVGGTSNGRYAKAKVNNVQGVILFPDTYTHPDGVTAPVGVNSTGATGWNGNSYTVADWTKMESAGCVFLPAAGIRYGSSVNDPGANGSYWSAAPAGTDYAYGVIFHSGYLGPAGSDRRYWGYSVRLVRQVTE